MSSPTDCVLGETHPDVGMVFVQDRIVDLKQPAKEPLPVYSDSGEPGPGCSNVGMTAIDLDRAFIFLLSSIIHKAFVGYI